MKPLQFEIYKKQTAYNHSKNDTLKGVILNNCIKKDSFEKIDDFDRISNELLIPSKLEFVQQEKKQSKKESFDFKKALKLGICAGSATAFSYGLATKTEIEALIEKI